MMYISAWYEAAGSQSQEGGYTYKAHWKEHGYTIYYGNVVRGAFFSRKVKTKEQRTFSKSLPQGADPPPFL
jgi:hypothetical protein